MKQPAITMESFMKDKDGICYKHPERTCKDCVKYPCFEGQSEATSCDFAKYGCIKYLDLEMKMKGIKTEKELLDATSSTCKTA